MNRIPKVHEAFNLMRNAMTNHNYKVNNILAKFANDVDAVEQKYAPYRDSNALTRDAIRELIPAVRVEILKEGIALSDALNDQIESVDDYMMDCLCKPVPAGLRQQLQCYLEGGIKPGKAEVEALLILNNGSWLGYRLLHDALVKLDCDYTFDYKSVADYENDLKTMKDFSAFVRFNPSFPPDHAKEGLQLFGRFGRKVQFTEGEHGDEMQVDYISDGLPIRDEKGNDTSSTWDEAMIAAMTGSHADFEKKLGEYQSDWESPNLFPDIKMDASVVSRRMAAEKTEATATAAEVVSQYAE